MEIKGAPSAQDRERELRLWEATGELLESARGRALPGALTLTAPTVFFPRSSALEPLTGRPCA